MCKQYYLGIDGGGTKTELLLRDNGLSEINRVIVGACNPNDIGLDSSKAVLKSGIEKVLDGKPCGEINVYAGIAGAFSGNNKQELETFFSEFGFKRFAVGSDIENLISLGFNGENGIAVIMGTGLGTFKVVNGKSIKVLSLGYLFEDGGSGYAIGRDGLKAHFNSLDGLEEQTIITKEIEKRLDYNKVTFLSNVYKGGKRYIASFAKEVFSALDQGDRTARKIVENNMKIVARLIEKIALKMNDDIKIVFAGGITNNSYAMDYLLKTINIKKKYRTELLSTTAMVEGAIRLARKL